MEVHGHVHAFAELPDYMKKLKDNDTHGTYYLEPTPDSFLRIYNANPLL